MTTRHGQTNIGLLERHLTREVFMDILRLYREKVGSTKTIRREVDQFNYLEETFSQLAKWRWAEWRFGSRFSEHSKLLFDLRPTADEQEAVRVGCNLCCDDPPGSGNYSPDAEEARTEFLQAIEKYLQDRHIAIEVHVLW